MRVRVVGEGRTAAADMNACWLHFDAETGFSVAEYADADYESTT